MGALALLVAGSVMTGCKKNNGGDDNKGQEASQLTLSKTSVNDYSEGWYVWNYGFCGRYRNLENRKERGYAYRKEYG